MISLATAMALKAAGLTWMPMDLDFFAIPDRQMDERIFVISDIIRRHIDRRKGATH